MWKTFCKLSWVNSSYISHFAPRKQLTYYTWNGEDWSLSFPLNSKISQVCYLVWSLQQSSKLQKADIINIIDVNISVLHEVQQTTRCLGWQRSQWKTRDGSRLPNRWLIHGHRIMRYYQYLVFTRAFWIKTMLSVDFTFQTGTF